MKEIKTAEEMINSCGNAVQSIVKDPDSPDDACFADFTMVEIDKDNLVHLLNEYASQFEPKWIPVEPVHEIEPGQYVVCGMWFGNRGLKTVFIRGKVMSSELHSIATEYMKIELPTNNIEG